MIFFARGHCASFGYAPERAAQSLGIFAGYPALHQIDGDDFFAELPSKKARRGERLPLVRSPGGWPVLLHGWIDNLSELHDNLNIAGASPAATFGAAVERWGRDADSRVIGTYAAIVAMPGGELRLSRSPWESFPLFVHQRKDCTLISTLPRAIFAAGAPKRLRTAAVEQMLAMEMLGDSESMFEGLSCVPHGAIVTVRGGQIETDRWYNPVPSAPVRLASDADYVEAASALLAEAVGAALRDCNKPAVSLSGGLDSAIVTAEILCQLPGETKLPSFTFRPHSQWDGVVTSGGFGDDWPYVLEFAKQHPRLDPHFVRGDQAGFDHKAEEIFLASDFGHPSRVLSAVYHPLFDAARQQGCDMLLSAGLGNATFSSGAPWAYQEFLRAGRWNQLRKLLSHRSDPRHPLRKAIAECLVPSLPEFAQGFYRGAMARMRGGDRLANPFLAKDGPLGRFRKRENIRGNFSAVGVGKSRADVIRQQYHGFGLHAEVGPGLEQVFGIRQRDVTAYRPLIEFCNAIPTDQFVRDGERRWLARRMAKDRMPEAQRMNTLYGQHNVDWHARMTPRLEDLRQEVRRIADHPELGGLLDTEAMKAALSDWPGRTPDDPYLCDRLRFYLPAAVYMRRYVDSMTGRNAA